MTAILDAIHAPLDKIAPVYVRCWRGGGRTGAVIGCLEQISRTAAPPPENA